MKLKTVISAALAALAAGIWAYRARTPKPIYKTIADIKPPRFRKGFDLPDWSKMTPLQYADTTDMRQHLVKADPYRGGRKEAPRESGSFDCPAAPGV